MAPSTNQKRVKNTVILRPFVYGTTAHPFDPVNNPKPDNVPADHTHSWTVFVKGLDDADISYWLKKAQFKLHESIPNPMRMVEAQPHNPLEIHETGWGEFEITIKLYYDPISMEKPQHFYHHLRLHPYGETEEDKEKMRQSGEIRSWHYEEQVFGEPYEAFWKVLTGGGKDKEREKEGGRGKGKGREREREREREQRDREQGERTALIPLTSKPDQPFSREAEKMEIRKLEGVREKVLKMREGLETELREKEEELRGLKEGGSV